MILSSRRPIFWVLLSALSLSGLVFTYKFFTQAFPIAAIDLKVDRSQVLTHASELAQKHNWGPQNYRQAASFEVDGDTKNYVELELGGTTAFNQMITGTLYAPYTWRVRHFREGETNETLVSFKPDGTPYDFLEKIAETTPGAKLLPIQARTLAEEKATKEWNTNFSEYTIVESSQEVRPNGRIDHTFVYERPTILLGEARYRLRLMVTGDKLTELNHVIKIPEGFFLRYAEMRAANKTISSAARIVMNILYLLFGCCIGLFLLTRQSFILWRPAFAWALILATLQLLISFNELPMSWMSYDTALSAQNFLLQYGVSSFINAIVMFILFLLSFSAAEGLTRKAFGHQIQLWKLWNPAVASSLSVLGRTIAGYLIVGFDLAFIVGTYMVTRTFFGWWLPSDTLINPNILATYVPWVSPAAQALNAGFWEECLFRAVPLASCALIGQRLGKRRLFLIFGFILQALVFGAAHADYPTQPAYGRLLELIIPSFIFGGIYVVYGLLPSIISHFIFDLVLMSMPLFISAAPGAWLHQSAVILWGLIPLFIVLYFRYRIGAWLTLSKGDYNSSWISSYKKTESSQAPESPTFVLTHKHIVLLSVVGMGAFATWGLTTRFKQDAAPFALTRLQAVTVAQNVLADKKLDAQWLALPYVTEAVDQNNRYVWQEGGNGMYETLTAAYYVPTPQWVVRLAKFNGDLEDRAEEYSVYIAADGTLSRMTHKLPEKHPGAILSEEKARNLAHKELSQRFNVTKEQITEISATPLKHPQRLDWTFVFNNQSAPRFKDGNGQLRISITISGDEVADAYRFVHVPEEWSRQDRNKQSLLGIITALSSFLLMLVVGMAALYALISSTFIMKELFYLFCSLFFLGITTYINIWPAIISRFTTSEPWVSQVFRVSAGTLVSSLIVSLAIALIYSMAHLLQAKSRPVSVYRNIVPAIVIGIFFGAISSALKLTGPSLTPTWASYTASGAYLPILGIVISSVSTFFYEVATLLGLLVIIRILSASWTTNIVLCSAALVLMGLLITSGSIDSIGVWLTKGIAIGILLLLYQITLLRSFPPLIIPTLATALCLRLAQQMAFAAYPGALLGNLLSILAVTAIAFFLYKHFEKSV